MLKKLYKQNTNIKKTHMFHLFDILLIELKEFLMIFYKPSFKKSDMMEYLTLKFASIQYHLSNLESMQAWTR